MFSFFENQYYRHPLPLQGLMDDIMIRKPRAYLLVHFNITFFVTSTPSTAYSRLVFDKYWYILVLNNDIYLLREVVFIYIGSGVSTSSAPFLKFDKQNVLFIQLLVTSRYFKNVDLVVHEPR